MPLGFDHFPKPVSIIGDPGASNPEFLKTKLHGSLLQPCFKS
jgi:hypothetical protein